MRVVLAQPAERLVVAAPPLLQKVFGLFTVLLEVWTRGEEAGGHTNLLSQRLCVRPNQAERRFALGCRNRVGTALSADWRRPCAPAPQYNASTATSSL